MNHRKYTVGSQHGNLVILSVLHSGPTMRETTWVARCELCGVSSQAKYRQLVYQQARCRDCYRRSVSARNRERHLQNRKIAAPRTKVRFVRVACSACGSKGCRLCGWAGYVIDRKGGTHA